MVVAARAAGDVRDAVDGAAQSAELMLDRRVPRIVARESGIRGMQLLDAVAQVAVQLLDHPGNAGDMAHALVGGPLLLQRNLCTRLGLGIITRSDRFFSCQHVLSLLGSRR